MSNKHLVKTGTCFNKTKYNILIEILSDLIFRFFLSICREICHSVNFTTMNEF